MNISIGDIGVAVAEIGRAGPRGEPGPAGEQGVPGVGSGHLELAFDYSTIGLDLIIGQVPGGSKVTSAFVEIAVPFSGTSFTVGTIAEPTVICIIQEADAAASDSYKSEPNVEEAAAIYLFPSFTVAPSSGSGLITIYYS